MRWKAMVLAMLVMTSPMAGPPTVAAQAAEDATIERFDAEKFWSYAGCAASIALSVGTGAWLLPLLACGKAATAYWTT